MRNYQHGNFIYHVAISVVNYFSFIGCFLFCCSLTIICRQVLESADGKKEALRIKH